MVNLTEVVSARIPDELARDLARIEQTEKSDRATVLRKLLSKAIQDWKREHALALYREGGISLWKAATLASASLREMMQLAAERKIPVSYGPRDLERDLEYASRKYGRK